MRGRPTLSAKRYLRSAVSDLNSAIARGEPPRTMVVGGPTGVGKTQFWKDMALMLGCRRVVEDLSIKVPGDLGIPRIDEVTKRHWFTMPPWWPEAGTTCDEYLANYGAEPVIPEHFKSAAKGIKFPVGKVGLIVVLEEICRSNEAIIAGAMNLLLDHQLNYNELPPWVWIVGTTNWPEDGYSGITLDRAQEERLVLADFKPSVGEWAKFSKDRCCPSTIAFFKGNPGQLRMKDDPNMGSDEDNRVPLRTATRVGELLKHMQVEEIRETGLDIVHQYIGDSAVAKRLVDAAIAVKEGGTLRTPVTAASLLADNDEAWSDFEEALSEKKIGLITDLLDGFPEALGDAPSVTDEDGNEIVPATAQRFLKMLDDERVCALGARLATAAKENEPLKVKVDTWAELLEAIQEARGNLDE